MTGRHATNKRWRLRIVQQPESEFFKDEGGKNHALEAVVRLESLGGHHLPSRYAPGDFVVPLRAALYYESERRVEESDQDILRMMATDPKSMWVRSDDSECHVRFRIEKVSRRKDGQRFKVLFEVDDSGECPEEFKHMKPVLTEPICVMSKRKAHAAGGRGRTRRRGDPDDVVATLDPEVIRKMERMQHLIGQLRSQVTDQGKRIEALEQSVYEAAPSGGVGARAERGRSAAPFASSGLMGLAQAADVHGGGQGSESPSHATEREHPWRGDSDLKPSPEDSGGTEASASGAGAEGGARGGVQTRSSARRTRRRGRKGMRQVSSDYGPTGHGTTRGASSGGGMSGSVELDDEDLRGALALSRGSSRNGSPRSPSEGAALGKVAAGPGSIGSPIGARASGAYARVSSGSTAPRGPPAYGAAASVAVTGGDAAPSAKRFRGASEDSRGGGAAPTSATLSAAVGGASAPRNATGVADVQGARTGLMPHDSAASTPASAATARAAVASVTYPTNGGVMRAALVPVSRAESSGSAGPGVPTLSLQRPDDTPPYPDQSPPPRRLNSSDMQFDFGPPGSPVERGNGGLSDPTPKVDQ